MYFREVRAVLMSATIVGIAMLAFAFHQRKSKVSSTLPVVPPKVVNVEPVVPPVQMSKTCRHEVTRAFFRSWRINSDATGNVTAGGITMIYLDLVAALEACSTVPSKQAVQGTSANTTLPGFPLVVDAPTQGIIPFLGASIMYHFEVTVPGDYAIQTKTPSDVTKQGDGAWKLSIYNKDRMPCPMKIADMNKDDGSNAILRVKLERGIYFIFVEDHDGFRHPSCFGKYILTASLETKQAVYSGPPTGNLWRLVDDPTGPPTVYGNLWTAGWNKVKYEK